MLNESITEYNVVRELLARCVNTTPDVGQKYPIITFDLGVVLKAMPIIWDKPDLYRNHIILIGLFYANMNYMHMIGSSSSRSLLYVTFRHKRSFK